MTHLSRRTLLRGMLAGTGVAIALPPLEIFFNNNGNAYAEGGFPRRFGIFSWGNGVLPSQWIPKTTGKDWELTEQLAPLRNLRNDLTVVTGMKVKIPNTSAHWSGPAGFLSGADLISYGHDFTFVKPTIDQLIAQKIGGATRFRSLELGVQPGLKGLSFSGKDAVNPPQTEPSEIFQRLFVDGFRKPGDLGAIDPKLGLRRSVLDAVLEDAKEIRAQVGTADQVRLDQHMSSIRDLEVRIAKLEEDPPNLAACDRPADPGKIADIEGRTDMHKRSRVISDLVAMAFACDLTRVLSVWYSDPLSDVLYVGADGGHHQLTHNEPGEMPQVDKIVVGIVEDLAYFLEKLRSVPEGEGTLLDNSLVLATTDVSFGRTHQLDEYPILLAGRAGGAVKTGFHYRSETEENASQVSLSILRTMGVAAASFGEDDARATEGFSAIET